MNFSVSSLRGTCLAIYVSMCSLGLIYPDRYDEVRKLEMLAVIRHWDTLKNSPAFKDKIWDVAHGKLPHAAQTLADLLMRASIKETLETSSAKPSSPK